MKFLTFTKVKLDGEESPRIIELGRLAVDIENIMGIYETEDKYDVPIKNVACLHLKDGANLLVKHSFDALLEEIAAAKLE